MNTSQTAAVARRGVVLSAACAAGIALAAGGATAQEMPSAEEM